MASGDATEINEDSTIYEETMGIFECFIETQLELDRQRNIIDPETPGLPPEDLPHTPDNRDNISWQIGKKLALIADTLVIDSDSRSLIGDIVQLVNVGPDDSRAFEEFSVIARKVMVNGITWQNVATLFYFGYCIARDRLSQGVQHFLSQLLKWIVSVFNQLGIFQWIVNQGGWANFLGYVPSEENNYSSWLFPAAVAGIVAVIGIMVYRKYARR